MERLSSRSTWLVKWGFPALMCVAVLFGLADGLVGESRDDLGFELFLLGVVTVYSAFLYRKVYWNVADQVRLSGETIMVCRGGVEERVALKDIINIGLVQSGKAQRVTLRLRRPGPWGDEIAFVPRSEFHFSPFARLKLVEDLIQRVDRARLATGNNR